MTRKEYEKPALQVYELKQRAQLLAESGSKANRRGYGTANENTWG